MGTTPEQEKVRREALSFPFWKGQRQKPGVQYCPRFEAAALHPTRFVHVQTPWGWGCATREAADTMPREWERTL